MSLATEIWGLIRTNLNQQIAAAKALFDDVQGERQELATIRDSAVTARDEAQAAVSDAANAARTEVARVVDGAPQDLDTIREVAEYAQNNRDITDQLNAAIGGKSDKGHTHTIEQVTGLESELDSRPRTQVRWSYYGRTDSSETNWVFTPIPLPTAPSLTGSNQRITPGVSGTWAIRLTCTDPTRQVEIFTPKGAAGGTGSCFMIATLAASEYITSYRYGAADGAGIMIDITKLD